MVNQIAAAHERDLIQHHSKIHLIAHYPTVEQNNSDVEVEKPTIKLQLQDGKNTQELLLNNTYEPDAPIYF